MFTDLEGEPIHPNSFSDRFDQIIRAAGLPRLRLHDLRHTHASLMLAAGVNPKVVQERLGHKDISVTLQTYSHVMPGMQEEEATRFAQQVRQSAR